MGYQFYMCFIVSVQRPQITPVRINSQQSSIPSLEIKRSQFYSKRRCLPDSTTDASCLDSTSKHLVEISFQRQKAKDLKVCFAKSNRGKNIKDSKILGWTRKNEITNGRWVMMGLAIGLLTENATGVNFVDQIMLTVSYLGIAEIGD